jgi:hypothetical protein
MPPEGASISIDTLATIITDATASPAAFASLNAGVEVDTAPHAHVERVEEQGAVVDAILENDGAAIDGQVEIVEDVAASVAVDWHSEIGEGEGAPVEGRVAIFGEDGAAVDWGCRVDIGGAPDVPNEAERAAGGQTAEGWGLMDGTVQSGLVDEDGVGMTEEEGQATIVGIVEPSGAIAMGTGSLDRETECGNRAEDEEFMAEDDRMSFGWTDTPKQDAILFKNATLPSEGQAKGRDKLRGVGAEGRA